MSEDKKYNGWTNYETWLCALWLDNEEGTQAYMTVEAQTIYDDAEASSVFTKEDQACLDFADFLKNLIEERAEDWMPDQTGMFADLLNAAIGSIDWYEIAEHYIGEVDKEADEAA